MNLRDTVIIIGGYEAICSLLLKTLGIIALVKIIWFL